MLTSDQTQGRRAVGGNSKATAGLKLLSRSVVSFDIPTDESQQGETLSSHQADPTTAPPLPPSAFMLSSPSVGHRRR